MYPLRFKGYKGEKRVLVVAILTGLRENKLCSSFLVEVKNTLRLFCLVILLTDLQENKLTFSALVSGKSLPK